MQRLRMGVVGAGLWGANHAHVFTTLPETELVAVCDVSPERAEAMKAETGAKAAYTRHEDLIADPHVDAVSIATPDFTHTPIILAALAAGKHVLSEKPLATTLEEANAIADAAARSKAKLMVDFHNRVSPAIVQVREAVASGEIGRPVHGSARLSNTTFVPLEMLSWASRSSALWFLGSHALDALRFVLADEVKRVYAVSREGVLASRGVATKDVHLAILEFAKGTVVTMENSWLLSPDNPQVFDFKLELVGDKGQVQADPSHNGAVRRLTGKGLRYADVLGVAPTGATRVGGFVFEAIARFVDAVLRDAPLLADVADGLAATRALAAIEQSAASGRPVDL
ncbi:Gfo/Idh/MocA family protein [Labrys wisconsinensis]|uniref:Dehydrogenase n=1 Tax=Labrys wisconsinensis TaxID=425677 RepID=A0ABU0JLT1_9HYPH|nr:Gfo/Idh/MocA family oxidoreductase [Labrys wisconsinensis]MDQ0474077.1 putative dehydrogenase [Labrys wisconsinensis]